MRTLSNYSLAVFLINDHARAVRCAYDLDEDGKPLSNKTYTFKTFDKALAKGDLVIVPTSTRVGFTGVRVEELDVDVDFNATYEMKWIVGKVDKTAYEEILRQETVAIETVKSAEKKRLRDELRDAVFAHQEEKLAALQLTDLSSSKPESPPEAAPLKS